MKKGKIVFFVAEICMFCGILFVFNYLSFGNYHAPFGVNFEEMDNRIMIEKYDWKGSVSSQYILRESRLDIPNEKLVEIEVLEYEFKETFATVVTLILALLFSICFKVFSVKFNIPLKSLHISAAWSRIILTLVIAGFVAISVRTGINYNDLIMESEKLLNELGT
ncbi:hypothetical protein [Halobacillus ihumii]|uniref:hypothetical protein n=1 Tax=Halobacillus ihumii TaxID=2686092 RepID=UPI0013CFB1A1|nr:hypothetical protein [Halobacillus ihumii]